MNPIQITDTLRESMIRYLLTTFDVNRDGRESALRAALRDSFDTPGALFNGPFLELTLPYSTGRTLQELAQEGVITEKLLQLGCFQRGKPISPSTPLYLHQEAAIRKLLSEQQNVVISSGTGSGKTECFLIPILNDLLVDPSPGVRAVIIYPLNALVNDQLDRLRNLLAGTDITFGRYTGELPQTAVEARKNYEGDPLPNEIICRDQIQQEGRVPQILITNYAMLEYLLLRPADAPLFNSGAWRFIVLDEAHTHAGSQGIEVGLLLRRLRHRLNLAPSETRCIATSATLTDDDAGDAAAFAAALFGVPVGVEDVIFGQLKEDALSTDLSEQVDADTYLHEKFGELIEMIRTQSKSTDDVALLMEHIGLIDVGKLELAELYADDAQAFLWAALRSNADIQLLRDYMARQGDPIAVQTAAGEVFGDRLPAEDREQALFHLIELGAIARPDEETPPLIPARYHLFARPPQGIWVCLNPHCPGKQEDSSGWSRLFATRRERCDACGSAVYPLVVCRTCGQSYVRAERDRGILLAEANPLSAATAEYFTWRLIDQNTALADPEEEEELAWTPEEARKFTQSEVSFCLTCQRAASMCACLGDEAILVTLSRVEEIESGKQGTRYKPVEHLNECPRCRDKAFGGTEIATPISLHSAGPLSIITNELYRLLPRSPRPEIAEKPGAGRKLLSFYDSRQGAARFAAYLQASVNGQTYRHIIPKAIGQLEAEKGRMPDLDEVAERCFQIAWDYRIFHNDAELSDELGRTRRPSGAQRDRLTLRFKEQAIAEFTTRRRDRQSLESLGVVGIEYFEPGWVPDFGQLAQETGVEEAKVRTLVEYLLDGLRNQKIVVLPPGVHRDSEAFGRNIFSPRLVRGNAQQYEMAWIGATERQHRRQLVKKILHAEGLDSSEESQARILNAILDWLLDETDLLNGSAADGYQLAYDRLFFTAQGEWYECDQCHRLSSRGAGGLICPRPSCGGHLQPADVDTVLEDNHYRHIFTRDLVPMRVEEHTAQLDSDKGRQYQEDFKRGNINVLSCSTTFEMGIDLGDLQAIVLSNVPPTVANYKQRAGRAGRRAGGAAFILSWASERPHDQTYFTAPAGIINGHVRVPHLAMQNQFILQRHVNAILFSAFMRYRWEAGHDDLRSVGAFFDAQVVDEPHYVGLKKWLEVRHDSIRQTLDTFMPYLGEGDSAPSSWLLQFERDVEIKGYEHYQEVTSYYDREIQGAIATLQQNRIAQDVTDIIDRYQKLLKRLRDAYLINHLSDRGILPSYSFPLHTVELMIHPDKARNLRLQRDVRQAIREYAPGQEIVADKRIWKSIGLVFYRETPQLFQYRICDNCNHLRIGKEAGIPVHDQNGPCPVCKETPANNKRHIYRYVVPDGFRSSSDSGMPAGQFVQRELNLTRSALIPRNPEDVQKFGEILEAGYSREGELLYVNEGNLGLGFRICLKCGTRVSRNKLKCPGTYRGQPCSGQLELVTLGFRDTTDTLQLTFHSLPGVLVPGPNNRSFWLSLMHALLQGASQALQIERRDIDGVLFPRLMEDGRWQQTIVLFDDVPGGAGHVRQIREEIVKVVRAALRIANCVDCAPDSSCYHCLRDYSNQYDHHILERGPAAVFLEALHSSLQTTEDPSSPNLVVALNLPRWFMQTVARAQHQVMLVADDLSLEAPVGERQNWLDVMGDLLKRDVQVTLGLTQPIHISADQPQTLSIARYLQVLLDDGLELCLLHESPQWQVVVDPHALHTTRALRQTQQEPFILGSNAGQSGLETVTASEVVVRIDEELRRAPCRHIEMDELSAPANVKVLNIDSAIGRVTEADLFSEVFTRPILRLTINDRYLYDHYRIVERLGAYIQLANQHNTLQEVTVTTWDAEHTYLKKASRDEQNRAIKRLQTKFPEVNIDVKRPHSVEHDRYVVLERSDGTSARIIVGKGLDFIKSDGTLERTYVVIEDPYLR